MNPTENLPFFALTIEWIIFCLIISAIFIRKISFFIIEKKRHINRKKISETLLLSIGKIEEISCHRFFLSHTDLLVVLETFNQLLKGEEWQELKSALVEMYLLEKARNHAKSRFWKKRGFAVRCLALAPQPEDEPTLLHLMDDPVFLVRSRAASAAIELGSLEGSVKILRKMMKEEGYPRYFYRDLLLKGSRKELALIIEVSGKEEIRDLQLACLEVLSGQTPFVHIPFLERYLNDTDSAVRLLALRALIRNPQENSLSILLKSFQDSHESIRAEAARGLEYFVESESFNRLQEALQDPAWSVRIQAVKTLKQMGKEGESILQQIDPIHHKEGYAAVQYAQQFNDF